MSLEKRLPLALLLSFVVLFGWQIVFPPPAPVVDPDGAPGPEQFVDAGPGEAPAPSVDAPSGDGTAPSGDGPAEQPEAVSLDQGEEWQEWIELGRPAAGLERVIQTSHGQQRIQRVPQVGDGIGRVKLDGALIGSRRAGPIPQERLRSADRRVRRGELGLELQRPQRRRLAAWGRFGGAQYTVEG